VICFLCGAILHHQKIKTMATKIILFLTLLTYSVVVSQSFMYMLALKNVNLGLGYQSYTALRKLLDTNMRSNFKFVLYAALLFSLLQAILAAKQPTGLLFITSVIAFAALVTDTVITVKGNLPVNDIINQWAPDTIPAGWEMVRAKWLQYFQYRQIANITGFVALLVGAVFGK
jgi:hypothetical protein